MRSLCEFVDLLIDFLMMIHFYQFFCFFLAKDRFYEFLFTLGVFRRPEPSMIDSTNVLRVLFSSKWLF